MITIISGTNRPDNNTRRVARICQRILEEKGEESRILSMEDLPSDFLNSEMYGERSEEMEQLLIERVRDVEKFIFVVPEYNGSIAGVLKVFLDSIPPRYFHHKKASLIGLSAGFNGNLRGLDHLTAILHYLQMTVLPVFTKLSFIQDTLGADDEISDPERAKELDRQMERFIGF